MIDTSLRRLLLRPYKTCSICINYWQRLSLIPEHSDNLDSRTHVHLQVSDSVEHFNRCCLNSATDSKQQYEHVQILSGTSYRPSSCSAIILRVDINRMKDGLYLR